MALVYVADESRDKLKEIARREGRTVAEVVRRWLETIEPVASALEEVLDMSIAPADPEEKWDWVKATLGVKCGCIFNDEMNVISVKDWGLFRAVKNGKLMEQYLAAHPGERDKYTVNIKDEGPTK